MIWISKVLFQGKKYGYDHHKYWRYTIYIACGCAKVIYIHPNNETELVYRKHEVQSV